MRVITGTARGRKLQTCEGEKTRPTSDMVKGAMFSAIQFEVPGAFVLDLFAGSGQLGIEALSRGARFCVFVDHSREAQDIIRENLKTTTLAQNTRVVAVEYTSFLSSTTDQFDLVLIDPPYNQGICQTALSHLGNCVNTNGIVICETDKTEELPQKVGALTKMKEYKYGKSKITIYRNDCDA